MDWGRQPLPLERSPAVLGRHTVALRDLHLLGPGCVSPQSAMAMPHRWPSSSHRTSRCCLSSGVNTTSTVLVWLALILIVPCFLATGFMCFLSSTNSTRPCRDERKG
jgi:hypothetical protein